MDKILIDYTYLFINSFTNHLNYSNLTKELEKISELFLNANNCKKPIKIYFEDKKFAIQASMKNELLFFNKLRIETLINLKIDCNDKNHIKNIYEFYKNYKNTTYHNKYDECLYNYVDSCINNKYEEDLKIMGSYKHIKFELLETVFHETQHIIQNNILERLEYNNLSNVKIITLFSIVFEFMYKKLLENNIDFKYTRENYKYPVEFEARYVAMKNLNEVKQAYFKNDKEFSLHIINTNFLPKSLNIKETVEEIYLSYISIFNIYKSICNNEHILKSNLYLIKNKDIIVDTLIKEYKDIENIIKINKEQL